MDSGMLVLKVYGIDEHFVDFTLVKAAPLCKIFSNSSLALVELESMEFFIRRRTLQWLQHGQRRLVGDFQPEIKNMSAQEKH